MPYLFVQYPAACWAAAAIATGIAFVWACSVLEPFDFDL